MINRKALVIILMALVAFASLVDAGALQADTEEPFREEEEVAIVRPPRFLQGVPQTKEECALNAKRTWKADKKGEMGCRKKCPRSHQRWSKSGQKCKNISRKNCALRKRVINPRTQRCSKKCTKEGYKFYRESKTCVKAEVPPECKKNGVVFDWRKGGSCSTKCVQFKTHVYNEKTKKCTVKARKVYAIIQDELGQAKEEQEEQEEQEANSGIVKCGANEEFSAKLKKCVCRCGESLGGECMECLEKFDKLQDKKKKIDKLICGKDEVLNVNLEACVCKCGPTIGGDCKVCDSIVDEAKKKLKPLKFSKKKCKAVGLTYDKEKYGGCVKLCKDKLKKWVKETKKCMTQKAIDKASAKIFKLIKANDNSKVSLKGKKLSKKECLLAGRKFKKKKCTKKCVSPLIKYVAEMGRCKTPQVVIDKIQHDFRLKRDMQAGCTPDQYYNKKKKKCVKRKKKYLKQYTKSECDKVGLKFDKKGCYKQCKDPMKTWDNVQVLCVLLKDQTKLQDVIVAAVAPESLKNKVLGKKQCKAAGRRYSKKRKRCYKRCVSKKLKFDKDLARCLSKKQIKAKALAAATAAAVDVSAEKAVNPDLNTGKEVAKRLCGKARRKWDKKSQECLKTCKSESHNYSKKKKRCVKISKKSCKKRGRVYEKKKCTKKCLKPKLTTYKKGKCKYLKVDLKKAACKKAGLRYSKKSYGGCYSRCKKSKSKVYIAKLKKCVSKKELAKAVVEEPVILVSASKQCEAAGLKWDEADEKCSDQCTIENFKFDEKLKKCMLEKVMEKVEEEKEDLDDKVEEEVKEKKVEVPKITIDVLKKIVIEKPDCKAWQKYDAKSNKCLIPGACAIGEYYSTRSNKCRKLSKNRCPRYGRVYIPEKQFCTETCKDSSKAVIDRYGKCQLKPLAALKAVIKNKCKAWEKFDPKQGKCVIPNTCPNYFYWSPRLKRCRKLSKNRCRRYGRVYDYERTRCTAVCQNTEWAIQTREGKCAAIPRKFIDDAEALLRGTNMWNDQKESLRDEKMLADATQEYNDEIWPDGF